MTRRTRVGNGVIARGWQGIFNRETVCSTLACLAVCGSLAPTPGSGQENLESPREEVIHYQSSTNLADAVTQLKDRIAAGKCKLRFEPGSGYLSSLLEALHIPISSQTLVFSKTSSQEEQTSPRTPRAIYFSQDVYVGWVPGCPQIDLAAMDPQRGVVFYTLEQRADPHPIFTRRLDCLRCHESGRTFQIPGLFVRSTYTGADGKPLATVREFESGHNSPLATRWAGWYVSGTHVSPRVCAAAHVPGAGEGEYHLGNLISTNTDHPEQVNVIAGANRTDLRPLFDASKYLSRHSDIIALLVLEHQVRMHNLITLANYEARLALAEIGNRSSSVDWNNLRPDGPWPQQRIAQAGERLLEYMLLRDEAPLNGPVRGTTSFAAQFQRLGPRAGARSLRDLDLQTRLFKYPCSFLIYSSSFDALPLEMKNYLWRRLDKILSGQDPTETYRNMSEKDRLAVLAILRETKPEFAAWLR